MPESAHTPSGAHTAQYRGRSVEGVREDAWRELCAQLVEDEDGAYLAKAAPGQPAPEGRIAALSNERARGLAVSAKLGPLDVALQAGLERVGRMRGKGANRRRDEGGGQPRTVLGRSNRVGVVLAKPATHHGRHAHVAAAKEAFSQHHSRRATGEVASAREFSRRGEQAATLTLLLDHDQLDWAADRPGEHAGTDSGGDGL
mmetsp:Transcript_30191/g.96565  ORF Transcript_30191/g.96565 Transcript_30191/m.96565 type:complete len:201 (-) Transcript_30191:313-915(-)